MRRIICFFLKHRWVCFGANQSKAFWLAHAHPQAGLIEVCVRCGKLWDDFLYGFGADEREAEFYYARRIAWARDFQRRLLA